MNHTFEPKMDLQKTIAHLKIDESARISGYTSEEIPVKLYELGLLPGSEIILKKRLPFGGPICIQMTENDNLIALRKSEASSILIESI
ncbi:FeoA family protein [Moheibacter sediminis]|uniref:Ferrous iron transport protein A n=1 Tax=Moheibacter sediminis TaxID=1434700 RepID=A0A1W2BID2_9FLAO|nr:FeoA family protein [Moheibacter sediminis]SMC72674.1 ferrous iron transport protein A [Moheibacter sediminis]